MKTSRLTLLALMLTAAGGLPLSGQDNPPPAPPAARPEVVAADPDPAIPGAPDPATIPPKKSREQLKKLLAPFALYPDPILAPILTACSMSPDIVQARRYLDSGKSAANLDSQPWDKSVKTLVRYPAVLKKLDADLERTNQIGEAFVYQQAEVLEVVQELREAAYAKGNLKSNPKQKVVREDRSIRIEPADPDIIYLPEYDPDVVYYRDYDVGFPFIRYGAPLALGAWLYYGFDWRDRYVGYYPGYWSRGVGYAAGPGFVAGRPATGFARWSPTGARPGIYRQRNAAAFQAGAAGRGGNLAPGAAARPGAAGATFAPGAAARGGAVLNPNSRVGRQQAAREARAARNQSALANPNARGARSAAVRDARSADRRGAIANPNSRGARSAAVRESRPSKGSRQAVRGSRGGRAPKFAAPRGGGGPKAGKPGKPGKPPKQ